MTCDAEQKKCSKKVFLILLMFIVGMLGGYGGGQLNTLILNQGTQSSAADEFVKKLPAYVPLTKGSDEDRTIDVVKKSSPSVVSIIISKDVSQLYQDQGQGQDMAPFDNLFQFGFPFQLAPQQQTPQQQNNSAKPQNQQNNQPSQKQQIGGGSGFVISANGLIVTNKHVVADGQADYTVVTSDGKTYAAKVLAKDPLNDLAVLKIDAKNLVPLPLGDSDSIAIGQTAIAIGNTLGEYSNTVTRGVISGVGRQVQATDGQGAPEVIQEAIQTDAAINPGNSGGPLLNLRGEVIGINTAINQSGQSIGFAIPINVVKRSVQSVEKFGRIIRPWLGVRYTLIDQDYITKNKLSVDHGAIILGDPTQKLLGVVPGGPADRAGLQDGDIILSVNGKNIDSKYVLSDAIGQFNPGDTCTLQVYSRGKTKDVRVKLEEYKGTGQ